MESFFYTYAVNPTKAAVFFDAETDLPIGYDPFNFVNLIVTPMVVHCVYEHPANFLEKAASSPETHSEISRRSHAALLGKTTCACFMASLGTTDFMSFDRTKVPVIFDTGVSMAITFDRSNFISDITPTARSLKLAGMANGIEIEGG